MRRYKVSLLVSCSCLSFSTFISSCKEETQTQEIKAVAVKFKKEGELKILKANSDSLVKTLQIEIADNDYERETGLMYRDKMNDDQAMLFVFPEAEYHTFYMKNTKLPLDIIFIDENMKVINIQKNAKPMDETSLPSDAPAKYVLEINAGLADKWQIEKGDLIRYN